MTKTQALKKGNCYKFYYFLPLDTYMTGFIYKGLMVTIVNEYPKEQDGWIIARDNKISLIEGDLLAKLEKLERHNLKKMRLTCNFIYSPMLTELLQYGLCTKEDVAYLVRELYINGLDLEGAIGIFSTLTQRSDLSSYFLQVAQSFFGEVVA